MTPECVEQVIERERPDALLPTMGGQTALNVAHGARRRDGVLEKYGVELIGANARAIRLAEDREQFGDAMQRIGLHVAKGGIARTFDEAIEALVESSASRRSSGRRSRSAAPAAASRTIATSSRTSCGAASSSRR